MDSVEEALEGEIELPKYLVKAENYDCLKRLARELRGGVCNGKDDQLCSVREATKKEGDPLWIEGWCRKASEIKETGISGIYTLDILLTDNSDYVTLRCRGEKSVLERAQLIANRLCEDPCENFLFVGVGRLEEWVDCEFAERRRMPIVKTVMFDLHNRYPCSPSRMNDYDKETLELHNMPI